MRAIADSSEHKQPQSVAVQIPDEQDDEQRCDQNSKDRQNIGNIDGQLGPA
jgi:hypothetical protein